MKYWIFDDPPWLPGDVMRLRREQNQKRVDQVEIREGLKSYFDARERGEITMPKIIKDKRQWYVSLTFPHTQCPYLFHDRGEAACEILHNQGGGEYKCNMDRCPVRLKGDQRD